METTNNETIVVEADTVEVEPELTKRQKIGKTIKDWGPLVGSAALGVATLTLKVMSDKRKERKYTEYLETKLDYTAEALGIEPYIDEVATDSVEDIEDSSL